MSAPRPTIKVTYDNVDVTADITNSLVSLTYKDKVTGETDELELQLEDVDGLWRDSWYPKKGATLTAQIGYDGNMVDCGTFQVDEIELSGPPDTVSIRAIAAFVSSKMRTKNSKANENVTLKQLAEQIAAKHGLTVDDGTKTVNLKRPDTTEERILIRELAAFARKQGAETDNATRYMSIAALQIETYKVIRALIKKGYEEEANLLQADAKLVAANMTRENCLKFSIFASRIELRLLNAPLEYSKTTNLGLHKIKIERSTQYRETDLEYLKRIASEYGFAFSIKGTVMVFYNIKALEESQAVTKVTKSNVKSYSLKDKTSETYKGATVKSHNSSKKEVVTVDVEAEPQSAENGDAYSEITKEDTIEIRLRSENKQQAEAKAKAALHKKNSRVQEGSLSLEGNPLLLAGNNFELSEMGKLSGKWHIEESTHTITKSGGYTTDIEIKRIARFSGDSAPVKSAGSSSKRGDTTGEENYLKELAASAYEAGKIETNDERYPRVDAILANANKIVTLLYEKKCDREAKQLQSNILMLQTFKSRDNAFKFSTNCQKIRIELIRARK